MNTQKVSNICVKCCIRILEMTQFTIEWNMVFIFTETEHFFGSAQLHVFIVQNIPVLTLSADVNGQRSWKKKNTFVQLQNGNQRSEWDILQFMNLFCTLLHCLEMTLSMWMCIKSHWKCEHFIWLIFLYTWLSADQALYLEHSILHLEIKIEFHQTILELIKLAINKILWINKTIFYCTQKS